MIEVQMVAYENGMKILPILEFNLTELNIFLIQQNNWPEKYTENRKSNVFYNLNGEI